jgi:hypothetical protein
VEDIRSFRNLGTSSIKVKVLTNQNIKVKKKSKAIPVTGREGP